MGLYIKFFFFFYFGSRTPQKLCWSCWTAQPSEMHPPNPSSSLLHLRSDLHLSLMALQPPGSLPISFHISILPLVQSIPISPHCFSVDHDSHTRWMKLTHWFTDTAMPPPSPSLTRALLRTMTKTDEPQQGNTLQKAFYWIQLFPKAQILETILQAPWIFAGLFLATVKKQTNKQNNHHTHTHQSGPACCKVSLQDGQFWKALTSNRVGPSSGSQLS